MVDTNNDLEALFENARALQKPELLKINEPDDFEAAVILVPNGMTLRSAKRYLDHFRDKPRRTSGCAELVDLASLIGHAKRFSLPKDAHAVLFADPDRSTPRLTAIYDYHDAKAPEWLEHQARYAFPLSDAWKAWTKANGVNFDQGAFATFLEDRILDVCEPSDAGEQAQKMATTLGAEFASPSRLLDLSRNLDVAVGQSFKSASKLSSGETQIQFVEQHTATDRSGAPVTMPGAVLLGIQVFQEGPLYQVPARLRYRVQGPIVSFRFDLFRTEVVFDHAFRESCDRAAKETGLPLFYGKSEASQIAKELAE